MDAKTQTTLLLKDLNRGDPAAAEKLLPLVYHELRQLAAGYFRSQRSDHTLQPTALVNDAFMKLVDQTNTDWTGRAHFLAVAATTMRRILVDHARARQTAKRGGRRCRLTLDEATTPLADSAEPEVLALHDALTELAELDERQHAIVEMRFFGGMKSEEIAEVLGVGKTTVNNDWRAARAWLNLNMQKDPQR